MFYLDQIVSQDHPEERRKEERASQDLQLASLKADQNVEQNTN